jgi:D-alanyl-D-alanine dipeptidase
MPFKLTACLATAIAIASIGIARAQLPSGFVYLSQVDPTIKQDIRYAGPHNFIGRPVRGYLAAECVLTEQAARALTAVQKELAPRNLSLVMWDCYRPARAVADFASWSRIPGDHRMKEEFYPNTDKGRLFALGYIASQSAHSHGTTVDLGIVPSNVSYPPAYDPNVPLQPCTAPKGQRFEDGTIDLGTGYDCLDPMATTTNPRVSKDAINNRLLLRSLMVRYGFRPYSREWWHFQLNSDPFGQAFDFPITPRTRQSRAN